jgi:predicted nucleic acid-binding Zn ribbon protein
MQRTNEQNMSDLLDVFFGQHPELKQRMMEERIVRSWKSLMGPLVARYTSTIYIRDKVLYLSITSSVLRSELLLNRDQLIKKLNDFCGCEVITQIVVR